MAKAYRITLAYLAVVTTASLALQVIEVLR